ncbi:MAG: FtsX-like permease family protein, partial [Gemmatimonadota bacterium]|nr:FtsX-like permease family protein [Gemmatimonadota bacterium]
LKHARREARSSWRRIGVYMSAISLGVGALVAINAFRGNVFTSIRTQSRALLGADLEIHSSRAFPDSIQTVLDSAEAAGTPVSYVTTMPSMARGVSTDATRLVQVRSVTGGYPYYGEIVTEPERAWQRLHDGQSAVVDQAALIQLGLSVGDSIQIGAQKFEVIGSAAESMGEMSFRTAFGPRVFIPGSRLEATGLVQFGSLVRYQAYLKIEDNQTLQNFLNRHNKLFETSQVGYDTVAEQVEDLTDALGNLTRFLGLVGLTALLLGGVGVASAINVFVREKLDTVAVLRCLGASQNTVFTSYLIESAVLGLAGAAFGVLIGIGVQRILPSMLSGLVPFDVDVSIDWFSVGAGLFIGLWVAAVFASIPLMEVRGIPPLRTLNSSARTKEGSARWRRLTAMGVLLVSVLLISIWQAPTPVMGFSFAGGITVTTLLLFATARLLMWFMQRKFPNKARYVIRQGVANLFRPQNQTAAVTVALGFGVFLVATIYVVQHNLIEPFRIDENAEAPNLFLFDVQSNQTESISRLLDEREASAAFTSLIPSRLSAINGRSIQDLMMNEENVVYPSWALRREYRHTFRDTLVGTETLVAGEWWNEAESRSGLPRVSVEQEIARDLHLAIGDVVTWNVQGAEIQTEISSIRTVNWARFELNFFFVFEPSALAGAPQTIVGFTRIPDAQSRGEFQRDLVREHPNVSVADLTLVQRTLQGIINNVTLGIRFMAGFSIVCGMIVLLGAIATSRFHRVRESVLLKTLGATRRQITQILITEYAAIGLLAAVTGVILAVVAGWGLIRFMFEMDFVLPLASLFWLTSGVTVLTTALGVYNGRDAVKYPPLAVMRKLGT